MSDNRARLFDMSRAKVKEVFFDNAADLYDALQEVDPNNPQLMRYEAFQDDTFTLAPPNFGNENPILEKVSGKDLRKFIGQGAQLAGPAEYEFAKKEHVRDLIPGGSWVEPYVATMYGAMQAPDPFGIVDGILSTFSDDYKDVAKYLRSEYPAQVMISEFGLPLMAAYAAPPVGVPLAGAKAITGSAKGLEGAMEMLRKGTLWEYGLAEDASKQLSKKMRNVGKDILDNPKIRDIAFMSGPGMSRITRAAGDIADPILQGGMYGMGEAFKQNMIGDVDVASTDFWSNMVVGSVFGSAFGGGLSLVGRAAAKRFFNVGKAPKKIDELLLGEVGEDILGTKTVEDVIAASRPHGGPRGTKTSPPLDTEFKPKPRLPHRIQTKVAKLVGPSVSTPRDMARHLAKAANDDDYAKDLAYVLNSSEIAREAGAKGGRPILSFWNKSWESVSKSAVNVMGYFGEKSRRALGLLDDTLQDTIHNKGLGTRPRDLPIEVSVPGTRSPYERGQWTHSSDKGLAIGTPPTTKKMMPKEELRVPRNQEEAVLPQLWDVAARFEFAQLAKLLTPAGRSELLHAAAKVSGLSPTAWDDLVSAATKRNEGNPFADPEIQKIFFSPNNTDLFKNGYGGLVTGVVARVGQDASLGIAIGNEAAATTVKTIAAKLRQAGNDSSFLDTNKLKTLFNEEATWGDLSTLSKSANQTNSNLNKQAGYALKREILDKVGAAQANPRMRELVSQSNPARPHQMTTKELDNLLGDLERGNRVQEVLIDYVGGIDKQAAFRLMSELNGRVAAGFTDWTFTGSLAGRVMGGGPFAIAAGIVGTNALNMLKGGKADIRGGWPGVSRFFGQNLKYITRYGKDMLGMADSNLRTSQYGSDTWAKRAAATMRGKANESAPNTIPMIKTLLTKGAVKITAPIQIPMGDEAPEKNETPEESYSKRAKELSSIMGMPAYRQGLVEDALNPYADLHEELPLMMSQQAMADASFLKSLITPVVDFRGNPKPTQADIDTLNLAMGVLNFPDEYIYDKIENSTLDFKSAQIFKHQRPVQWQRTVDNLTNNIIEYAEELNFQQQMSFYNLTGITLGAMQIAPLTTGIAQNVYAAPQQAPNMAEDKVELSERSVGGVDSITYRKELGWT